MSPHPSSEVLAESLFLLDGSALAYRAHFAMAKSKLSSADGVPTGGIYGFTSELFRILEQKPKYISLVMDTAAPTFRHEQFPEYKATRQRMPEELVEQIPWMKKCSEALGIRVLELDGFEADDLMGTLARQAEAKGISVFMVTGDKDFMQLVSDKIHIYNIMKKGEDVVIIGKDEVFDKFGVEPERVIDVLGLMGDTSDNVPGVPGIGEKTAKKLITEHGTMENLLDSPRENISPRARKNLSEYRDQALLSKKLVTIDINVPIDASVEDLKYAGPERATAAELFRKLGFRSYAEAMSTAKPTPPSDSKASSQPRRPEPGMLPFTDESEEPEQEARPSTPDTYHLVRTETELDALIEKLKGADIVAVDTETTGLDVQIARIVGFSFSISAGDAWYVPLNLDPPVVPDPAGSEPGEGVVAKLRPFLEDTRKTKCGQNAKYDLMVMRNHGVELSGLLTDTMIAAYLLEPHQRERNLDALALRHFGHTKIKTSSLIGKGKNQITMDQLPVEDVSPYACEDADYTFRLAELFLKRLDQESLRKLHDEVEIPLINVLADMQTAGIRVDKDQLHKMAGELEKQVEALNAEIREIADDDSLNVNSPKQLGIVLFEKLKIHEALKYKPKRTKTGYATGQEVLEALSGHPLPALILEFRKLSKLLNTYVRTLPELVAADGRIHASFNQTIAATGRLSSSDPNLQNIPIRTEVGRRIREAFLPADNDSVLFSADYSQVELRIMAHLSKDENMLKAFRSGADIHRDTAARIFDVEADAVDATMRSRAKAINFGILYGMGPQRLSRETGLSMDEAKTFIARYFEAFPTIQDFIEGLKESARELGFAETVLGRRRPIPDIKSTNGMLRSQAENMAVNTPIQGSAADIIKVAMANIWRKLRSEKLASRMILTVHDELVFDVPKGELKALTQLVKSEMEQAYPLDVPLEVGMGHGKNWLEAH